MAEVLKNLHICGNILSSSNYSFFALQCTQCDATLGQWSSFLRHLEQEHGGFKEEALEDCSQNVEDEIEFKPEDLLNDAFGADDASLPYIEEEHSIYIETKKPVDDDNHELMIEVMEAYAEQSKNTNEDSAKNVMELSSDESLQDDKDDNLLEDFLMESSGDEGGSYKKFRFNLADSDYLIMSLDFLKIFQTQRLLWDPKHVYYRNPRMRSLAQSKMKKFFLDKRIDLSEKILQSTISTLLRKYKLAKQEKEEKGELNMDKERLLRKCSFLDEAMRVESNTSDEGDGTLTKDPTFDGDAYSEEKLFSTKVSNLISFTETDPLFIDFIEQYKKYPILWDTTLYNYNHRGERKRILKEWSDHIKTQFNTELTYDELSFSIIEFRRVYYKNMQRQGTDIQIDALGKFVLEKGSYLPPKATKQPIKCQHCSKIFLLPHTLQRHIYVDHGIGEKPFKCNFCEQRFEDHLVHRRHELRYHYKDYRFNCEHCKKAFFTRDELERHVMKHTGEKKFVCELCGRGFAKKTNLRLHNTRVHLRQRNFACNMCPKAFYTKRLLQDHINAHLNIRDKICPTCGKGFTSHHSLIRHKQIHSEVKKYVCKLCDARFHQFVGLNSHMKNTHKYVRGKNETASDDEDRQV